MSSDFGLWYLDQPKKTGKNINVPRSTESINNAISEVIMMYQKGWRRKKDGLQKQTIPDIGKTEGR